MAKRATIAELFFELISLISLLSIVFKIIFATSTRVKNPYIEAIILTEESGSIPTLFSKEAGSINEREIL